VTVTLTATDETSGIAATYYSLNAGAEVEGTSITITDDGEHTLTYYSVDTAGNTEPTKSATVQIDKTAPTVTIDSPVDKTYNTIYISIQSAIDDSDNGDTIYVCPGTYSENVDVTKSLNIKGAGADATIVRAVDVYDDVFDVTADYVNINGITVTGTVKGAWPNYPAGIHLYGSTNSKIENVDASNNYKGIHLSYSSNNNIIANKISDTYLGIEVAHSSNNIITNNRISNNPNRGIWITSSSNNNKIANNIVSNVQFGISNGHSSNNIFSNNRVSNNDYGIHTYYSDSITITNNIIDLNNRYGIWIEDSSGSSIHDNHFNNVNNYYFAGVTVYSNNWNGPTTGNYWAHPDGAGFSQTCTDAEADGICDSPYDLLEDGTNVDNLPLQTEDAITPFIPSFGTGGSSDQDLCLGPISLENLADGPHSVTVYATDIAGNINLDTVEFTVDAQTTHQQAGRTPTQQSH
jgi:parallel beta-helix repeat protein